MCASCGYPTAPGHWTDAGLVERGARFRARFRRAAILQAILPAYGLTAHDGGLVPGIQLATLTGRQALVSDLTELWAVAEQLAGRPVDPLDPRFIGAEEAP